MISEKELKVLESNIGIYQREGLYKRGDYGNLVEFYLKTAEKTLQTADALTQISENSEIKKKLGLLEILEALCHQAGQLRVLV